MARDKLPTWRQKYGCQEPLCNRSKVFGRDHCALHDRPDWSRERYRWVRDHPDEQLPCAGCAHRRIFHTRLAFVNNDELPGRKKRATPGETMVHCSIADCKCATYRPI